MLRCWEKSPDDRPSFDELYVNLQGILHEETVGTFQSVKYCFDSFGHILSNNIAKAVVENDKTSYPRNKARSTLLNHGL